MVQDDRFENTRTWTERSCFSHQFAGHHVPEPYTSKSHTRGIRELGPHLVPAQAVLPGAHAPQRRSALSRAAHYARQLRARLRGRQIPTHSCTANSKASGGGLKDVTHAHARGPRHILNCDPAKEPVLRKAPPPLPRGPGQQFPLLTGAAPPLHCKERNTFSKLQTTPAQVAVRCPLGAFA